MLKEVSLENITGLSDVMFKAIMYKHKNILIKLLEVVLEQKIDNIEYLSPEIPVRKFIEKGKRLDLKIEDTDSYIDIEVTKNYEIFIINRNLAFVFQMYCDTVERGDNYDKYKKVKSIGLIGNKKSKSNIRTGYIKDQNGDIMSDMLLYSEIYVDNFIKMYYNKDRKAIEKYKYLIMLGLNKEQIIEFNKEYGDDIVNEYVEEFNKVMESEEFQPLFSKEEDERRIRNSYLNLGFEQGQEERNIEIAQNMLNDGIDLENISKYTGLSIDFINNLK